MRRKSQPNPATQERFRAEAIASLEECWRLAKKFGPLTDEEIDAEIAIVRAERFARKSATPKPSPASGR